MTSEPRGTPLSRDLKLERDVAFVSLLNQIALDVQCWYFDILILRDKVVLHPTSDSVPLGMNTPTADSVLGPNAPSFDSFISSNALSSDSVLGSSAPTSDSVAVGTIADNRKMNGKKSGSVAYFWSS